MFNQKKILILFTTITAFGLFQPCKARSTIEENTVSENIALTKRLEVLFLQTKLACFGRYALRIPQEAELISGGASLPSTIGIRTDGLAGRDIQVLEDIEKIKLNNPTSEIIYNGIGPIEESWQIQYFENEYTKKEGDIYFNTYITKGNITFTIGDSTPEGQTKKSAEQKQVVRAKNLHLRKEDEIPSESGNCIPYGFIFDNSYNEQEIVNTGLYLPSLPDVTFSVSSNKNAYGDYSPAEFERNVRGDLSLIHRIQQAKDRQGNRYPKRTLLREGKRNVQHWQGEESLIRRTDGVHDFEWALVGKPRDIANPSVLEVHMYTKVAHNTVGAAKAASLTDDEAIALWDKLLSGLKFRVKVPGAPPGSYYIDPDKPAQ
ncbi:T6SS immunity protein Tli4 family protein [Janthinobacterium sp. P210006]|uniref:T6SS immunity protein Tli4 family protein n=1 Tax=Janthinobacterium sp. P210006 TaxID=3112939 RepID=UPI002E261C8D|nr:T6SS immunity protein Tli4 family protein [Janthinobacterium sp. P210006]